MKKVDNELKNVVNDVSEKIKKNNNIEKLPESGLTKEEEEEAKQDSTFLSDDMEESAKNFSEANEITTDEAEHETEMEKLKKYQAEVVNAMNNEGVYKKIDSEELEKIENISTDSKEIHDEDYSLPCPLDFFRTSSGCIPLKSYKGPCKKIQDKLMYLHDSQKQSWAEICETNWPDMPKECPYGTDYNAVCPIGWKDIGKGICRSVYENEKCSDDINFSNLSIEEKKKIEKMCNVRWRCKSVTYITNFESVCPLNWTKIGDYKCKAPEDYNGDCPKISNLKKYNTIDLKKKIEIACLVNWPYTIKVNEYERDYNISCPIGWFLISNGNCKAPENYQTNFKCNDEVNFVNMTSSQKESYSTACNVDFPFKDRKDCKRDYSFECPMGWVRTNKKNYCKAPLNYKSNFCKNVSNFKNLSERNKYFYLNSCNIDWPCEGEIQNSMMYTKIAVDYFTYNIRKKISGAVDSITGIVV